MKSIIDSIIDWFGRDEDWSPLSSRIFWVILILWVIFLIVLLIFFRQDLASLAKYSYGSG